METNPREVYEIFDELALIDDRKKRIRHMAKYKDHHAFRDVLIGALHPLIRTSLPETPPPYTPGSEESPPSTLRKLHKKFSLFADGGNVGGLSPLKVQKEFLDLLESIHPKDADIVVQMMMSKQLPIMGITRAMVKEAFPGIDLGKDEDAA